MDHESCAHYNCVSLPVPAMMLAVALADDAVRSFAPGGAQWRYDHAMMLVSLVRLSDRTGRRKYRHHAESSAEFLTGNGTAAPGYRAGVHDLEQSAAGWALLELWSRQRNCGFLRSIRAVREDLALHPRTAAGVFWYRKTLAYRVWLEGAAMYVPFLASFALEFDEPDIFDDICSQMILLESWLRDGRSGLLHHAWDESLKHVWAHPATGCSPHICARGMASFGVALVELLDHLPGEHAERAAILAILARFAAAAHRFQDPATGLWFHVVDQPDRARNFTDASASALLLFALGKAVRLGFVDRRYRDAVLRGFRGLLFRHVAKDGPSGYRLNGICPASDLAITAEWDGSFDWYVNRRFVSNDAFGWASVILACIEIDMLTTEGR